eukprot:gnl/TRDRNA2_/TRDRNA2_90997_c0_seq1.p1 gnl/TRDRNA2_/TRDRNA2_90997_c0~~gnl/TRDRNA2_/TRDRNA2_90997_c0_seq1.p1  ORF type:complete len:352 (+),score=69.12 gnl/TRDRNA2_/TRDRNA2_90997_c0_seq1:25-1080(+)
MPAGPSIISRKKLVERIAVMLARTDLLSISLKQVRQRLEKHFGLAAGSLDKRKAEIDELVVAEIEHIASAPVQKAAPSATRTGAVQKAAPSATPIGAKRKSKNVKKEKVENRRKSQFGKMLEQKDEGQQSEKRDETKRSKKLGQKTSAQAQGSRVLARPPATASGLKGTPVGLLGNVCLDVLGSAGAKNSAGSKKSRPAEHRAETAERVRADEAILRAAEASLRRAAEASQRASVEKRKAVMEQQWRSACREVRYAADGDRYQFRMGGYAFQVTVADACGDSFNAEDIARHCCVRSMSGAPKDKVNELKWKLLQQLPGQRRQQRAVPKAKCNLETEIEKSNRRWKQLDLDS